MLFDLFLANCVSQFIDFLIMKYRFRQVRFIFFELNISIKEENLSNGLSCVFVTFSVGVLVQVWYLIVSIPDLCLLTYFNLTLKMLFL